jgi:hypothetical protein
MKVGGSGRDSLMMVFPVVGLAFVVTVWFGGPSEALSSAERLLYDLWNLIVVSFRR